MSDNTPDTAVAEPPAPAKPDTGPTPSAGTPPKAAPRPAGPGALPPYRVLLHNDDVNPMDHVVRSIRKLTPLGLAEARAVMMSAHTRGVALVLVTHKERAELYVEQFRTLNLLVTIEPA